MKTNIEIGEYVRNNKGNIGQVIGIFNGHCQAKYHIQFQGTVKVKRQYLSINTIINHSKQLIDLIEAGDLVKFKNSNSTKEIKGIDCMDIRTNESINLLFPNAEFCDGFTEIEDKKYMIFDLDYLIGEEESNKIDWILTHEEIEKGLYKVGE